MKYGSDRTPEGEQTHREESIIRRELFFGKGSCLDLGSYEEKLSSDPRYTWLFPEERLQISIEDFALGGRSSQTPIILVYRPDNLEFFGNGYDNNAHRSDESTASYKFKNGVNIRDELVAVCRLVHTKTPFE